MKLLKILALLMVGAFVYQGVQAIARSRSLQLDRFEVEGNTEARISTQAVIEATGAEVGDQLLGISTQKVSVELEKLPWVAEATVERILPSTLRISIDEREPSYVIQTGQGSFLADDRGLVLQEGSEDLVNLVEMPLRPIRPGNTISTAEFRHASRILSSLPSAIRSRVTRIRASSIDQIQLETGTGPVIYYGAAEKVDEKNFAVESLLERTKGASPAPAVIDVRAPARPVTRPR